MQSQKPTNRGRSTPRLSVSLIFARARLCFVVDEKIRVKRGVMRVRQAWTRMWDPDRAYRFCRSEGASDEAFATTDRVGLPIDAGQSRRGTAWSQLEQGTPGRIRLPQGVGLAADRSDGRGI